MINQILRFVLGLTFLPERARRWIFGTGTRVIEVLNLTLLTTLSVLFWFDHGEMMRLSNYRGFVKLFGDNAHVWMTCLFGLLAVLAAAGIASTSERPRRLGGFALLASGCIWWAMSAGFAYGYPPLTTGMVVYPVLGMFCGLCGQHIMYLTEQARTEGVCECRN